VKRASDEGGGSSLPRQGYRFIEHTADLIVEGWAESRSALYVTLSAGLIEAMGGRALSDATEVRREISLSAPDAESLLVDWLNTIVSTATAEGLVPVSTRVSFPGGDELYAELVLSPAVIQDEIKAVTYHGISLTEQAHEYKARVTCDL
jgi:SHS2 domain-containing protein